MAEMRLNTDALAHNARMTMQYAGRWGVSLLPILKAVGSHPAARAVLRHEGLTRFGFAEIDEPHFFGPAGGDRRDRVLIQLTPPSRATEVAERFGRSFQAVPEVLRALDSAVASAGLPEHEILIMVDLGDSREGLDESEVTPVLDIALKLPHLRVVGLGTTLCCLGENEPPPDLSERLTALKDLFVAKGIAEPVVSIGGSYFCRWLEENPVSPITELRLGDPFILGEDIYRNQDLPGGPFRRDVCGLTAEVVELRTRWIAARTTAGGGAHHLDGQPGPQTRPTGRRLRALLDMGRFHVGLDRRARPRGGDREIIYLESINLPCDLPEAVITGVSASYLILDVTNCSRPVQVGQSVVFWPGYWGLAQAFRNPAVKIQPVNDGRLAPVLDGPTGVKEVFPG